MKSKHILIILFILAIILGVLIAYFVPLTPCKLQKNKTCTLYQQYFPNVTITSLLIPMRLH